MYIQLFVTLNIVNVKRYVRLCNIENLKNVEAKKFVFKRNKFV